MHPLSSVGWQWRFNSFKLLGIHISDNLAWALHIDAIARKVHHHQKNWHVVEYSNHIDWLHHSWVWIIPMPKNGGCRMWTLPSPPQLLTSPPSKWSTWSTASRKQLISSKIHSTLATLSSCWYYWEGGKGAREPLCPDSRTASSHQLITWTFCTTLHESQTTMGFVLLRLHCILWHTLSWSGFPESNW